MNNLNFIKTLPPEKQKNISLWYTTSSALLCLLLAVIVVLQLHQLHRYYGLKSSLAQLQKKAPRFAKAHTRHQTLQKRYNQLMQCQQELTLLHTHITQTVSGIQQIIAYLPADCALQQCSLQAKQLHCTVQCNSLDQATQYLNLLRAQPTFTCATLASMHITGNNEKKVLSIIFNAHFT